MKKWEIQHKGHTIRVESSVSNERLFVDDELQDEYFGLGVRSRLYGIIRKGDGYGEQVKVALGGGWFVQCRIFVDHHLVFHSKPDQIASSAIANSNIKDR